VLLLAGMVTMQDNMWQSQSVTSGKTYADAWLSQSRRMHEDVKVHASFECELAHIKGYKFVWLS
jgi:hypothetical protein